MVLADKVYDANYLRQSIAAHGALAITPTTHHAGSNIRSTSISIPSAIASNAASQNISTSAALQSASKKPPSITEPSPLSLPLLYETLLSTPPRDSEAWPSIIFA